MTSAAAPRRVAVTDEIRTHTTIDRADYSYACEIDRGAGDRRPAERWTRAMFEDAPRALRSFIVAGWVAGLRLRLAPRSSPGHILGWTIVSSTPSTTVLAASSPLLEANLVVQAEHDRVVHATFIAFGNAIGQILWVAARPIHERTIPYLLTRAAAPHLERKEQS